MLNTLKSINIKGGYFNEDTTLSLFDDINNRLSFIYGRNGSGKTSISNAVLDLKNNNTVTFEKITFLDDEGNPIILTDDDKNKIHVFNEKFIDSNLKFADDDGMNTIVMFGEQIELEEELTQKEESLRQLKKEYDKAVLLNEQFNNEKNTISPLYYKNTILNILKSDHSWAAREQKIKNNSKKSPVNESILSSILSFTYKKNIKSERELFEKNLKFLSTITEESIKYQELSFSYNLVNNYESNLVGMLTKKIEQPKLTERENHIYEIIQRGGQNNIDSAKEHFSHNSNTFCPYCFQNVTDEYKKQLIAEISNVLNEEVENHRLELDNYILKELELNVMAYNSLNSNLCQEISELILEINEHIRYINDCIINKKSNVYSPQNIDNLHIRNLISALNSKVSILTSEVRSYNNKMDNINKTIEETQKLNKIITRHEINEFFEYYNAQMDKMNINNRFIEEKRLEIRKISEIINEIRAKKKNFNIALKRINDDLDYLFFSKGRLALSYENDKYSVLSNGNKVKLKKLSVGERNAIALCYFFALVLENTNETNEYSNDFFIVIDDPISSFDFENKIGIYSLLRLKLSKMLVNNENNKIIVMTHEVEAILNFEKYNNDLKPSIPNISSMICYYNLYDKKTNKLTKFGKNVYTQSLTAIYDYANTANSELDLTIGNTMRKVVESFSTFLYKSGVNDLMRDKDILSLLPENTRDYFENFMYRLVLNGESHMEESSQTYPYSDFFELISPVEKQITAKNLLIFLYLINPIHLKKHLNNEKYVSDIDNWSKLLQKELDKEEDNDSAKELNDDSILVEI